MGRRDSTGRQMNIPFWHPCLYLSSPSRPVRTQSPARPNHRQGPWPGQSQNFHHNDMDEPSKITYGIFHGSSPYRRCDVRPLSQGQVDRLVIINDSLRLDNATGSMKELGPRRTSNQMKWNMERRRRTLTAGLSLSTL